MKVCLSPVLYSSESPIVLNVSEDSIVQNASRRVSRTVTLDGECIITDSGFSHADRTLRIKAVLSNQSESEKIWSWFQTYSLLNCAIPEGVFLCAIETCDIQNSDFSMNILVKEKL